MVKIRVTIDLDKAEESMSSLFSDISMSVGCFGCDKDGAYRMYYKDRTNLVEFEDVEVIEK